MKLHNLTIKRDVVKSEKPWAVFGSKENKNLSFFVEMQERKKERKKERKNNFLYNRDKDSYSDMKFREILLKEKLNLIKEEE